MSAGQAARRRGGPPLVFALIGVAGIALGALLIAAQALGPGSDGSGGVPTMAPAGDASTRTRDQVAAALGADGLQVQEPQTAFRPGESPALVDVPRRLLRVVVPSDPGHGYVVIYELPTSGEAERVGREFLDYLASGTGAIQYPRDTRFVLRRVGSTLVFFPWSADASPEPQIAQAAAVLDTVGEPLTP